MQKKESENRRLLKDKDTKYYRFSIKRGDLKLLVRAELKISYQPFFKGEERPTPLSRCLEFEEFPLHRVNPKECPSYPKCLDFAVANRWISFSCSKCPLAKVSWQNKMVYSGRNARYIKHPACYKGTLTGG